MIPTNEQIEKQAESESNGFVCCCFTGFERGFTKGATWMKEQMLSGVSESFDEWLSGAHYERIDSYEAEFAEMAWQAASLSYEKRLAEKDAEIETLLKELNEARAAMRGLEIELREAFTMMLAYCPHFANDPQ